MNARRLIKAITFPFRYSAVFGLARLLTPTFCKEIMQPIFSDKPLRPMLQYVRDSNNGDMLIGAEIGVYKGENALSMLHHLPLKQLYLIDPYQPYLQQGILLDPSGNKYIAHYNLKKFKNTINWTTPSNLPSNLDFIYIDANHDYEPVKKDILTYFNKVKQGGIIGGHDYTNDFPGVIRAVGEFVAQNGFTLHVEQPDWWLVKDGHTQFHSAS